MATSPEKITFRDRIRQIGAAFQFTRTHDKLVVPLLLAAFLLPILIAVVVALITGAWALVLPFGFVVGFLLATVLFGRRFTQAHYRELEGQPGGPAGVLQTLRGNWKLTPAVAVTPQQDMVHRVVGPPGVVLVIEGSPSRLKNLVVQEKKRVSRVAPEIPVYDVVVGDGEGQVPLRKLQQHCVKLPRNITPKQVNALDSRLQALGAARPPIPKGPLPKGARIPKGAKANRKG
jgi:hypothetical protein